MVRLRPREGGRERGEGGRERGGGGVSSYKASKRDTGKRTHIDS